jgi:hypothetical protein
MLRRIFGPKRDEMTGGWRKLHNESFIACTLLQVKSNEQDKENEMGRGCSTDGGGGMHIAYWCESQKERDHWKTKTSVGGQY